MNLYEKLMDIQKSVAIILKDETNTNDKYDYASGSGVLRIVRPKMDELGLLLFMKVNNATFHEGTTKSGTVRFLTEIWYTFTWHDVESGEEVSIPWYGQGDDLAGPKGPGKSASYAEKYFLLKQFHAPTDKDDPDSDGRTKTGELKQRGTQAAKESADFQRKAITQILQELYSEDAEKIKSAIIALTKNDARQYVGVDSVDAVSQAALPIVYDKFKKAYEKRIGHAFSLKEDMDNAG